MANIKYVETRLPDIVPAGEPFTISHILRNEGETGEGRIEIKVDEKELSQTLSLEKNESTSLIEKLTMPFDDITYHYLIDIFSKVPAATVDFPSLSVLDIEGIPFTKAGMEAGEASRDAFIIWYKHWTMATHNMYLFPSAGATWDCAGEDLLLHGTDRQIADAFVKCGVTIIHRYGEATSWGNMYALAQDWVEYREDLKVQRLTAHLAEPIVMPKIRGVSMTVIGKADVMKRYIALGQTVMTENYLWYEPTFAAPQPPPAFRGGGTINGQITYDEEGRIIRVDFVESQINTSAVFARGYYYPGIYDGKLSIRWFSSAYGREYATYCDFRIKNLAQVIGTGVI